MEFSTRRRRSALLPSRYHAAPVSTQQRYHSNIIYVTLHSHAASAAFFAAAESVCRCLCAVARLFLLPHASQRTPKRQRLRVCAAP